MTREGFRRYLRPYLDGHVPFLAYWYPNGCGLLKTGPIPVTHNEYVLHQPHKPDKTYRDYTRCRNMANKISGAWMETIPVEGKPRQISAGTLTKWQKLNDRLRRQCGGDLITVEYDGTNTSVEGSFEL